MKKILILIVLIAMFLHFNPQPEVTQWYENKKSELLNIMAESTVSTSKIETKNLFSAFQNEFLGFSTDELKKLKDITHSIDDISAFHQKHCKDGASRSNLFHPDNEDKVCQKLTNFIKNL
jgi:hypothetical protein